MRAPHGSSWLGYVWFVLRHGIAFAVWGPVVGAFFSPGVLWLPLAILTAYITSMIPAFATGCAVAIIASVTARQTMLYVAAAVIGAALSAPVGLWMMRDYDSTNWMMIHAFSGAVAALLCTFFTQNIRRERQQQAE